MPPALVLVHSPLVGSATWEPVAARLRGLGHRVIVPGLTGALAEPPYWPRQVAAVAAAVAADGAGHPLVLVGHSGAGPLLPAIGESLARVAGYVYVDAGLPAPGRSWMAEAPPALAQKLRAMQVGGWLPPWSEWWGDGGLDELIPEPTMRRQFAADCPRLPVAMFEEARPPVSGWPGSRSAYLRLSDGYREEADQAAALGWPTIALASHHLGMLTDPEPLVGPLLKLVRRLGRPE